MHHDRPESDRSAARSTSSEPVEALGQCRVSLSKSPEDVGTINLTKGTDSSSGRKSHPVEKRSSVGRTDPQKSHPVEKRSSGGRTDPQKSRPVDDPAHP